MRSFFTLTLDAWQTAIAAQATIALRLWSFATPETWQSTWGRAELWRMVSEKQLTLLKAGLAMQQAALTNRGRDDALHVLARGLAPYRRTTGANARRLARRR